MKHKLLAGAVMAWALTGCSVYQAANKTGEEVTTVAACETLSCLQTLRTAELVDEIALDEDNTQYVFRIQRRQGSYVRSLTYGAAAFWTLGLSELATTPMEGAIQNEKQMGVEAVCDNLERKCHRLVIAQTDQPMIYVRGGTEEELAALELAKAEAAEAAK